jgi:hypothetical protein
MGGGFIIGGKTYTFSEKTTQMRNRKVKETEFDPNVETVPVSSANYPTYPPTAYQNNYVTE